MINGKELELEWHKSIGSVDSDSPSEILVTENKESILFFHSSSVIDDFENKGSLDIYIYINLMNMVMKYGKNSGVEIVLKLFLVLF